jgi:hypothetical protein
MAIKCPRRCDESFVERYPSGDTPSASAFLCCACGTVFFITKVIPHSEERQLWKDKYGEKDDI